jgi:hypothetical protein
MRPEMTGLQKQMQSEQTAENFTPLPPMQFLLFGNVLLPYHGMHVNI